MCLNMPTSSKIWAALQGIVCVYKPIEQGIGTVRKNLTRRIVDEANEVCVIPQPRTIEMPIVTEAESGALVVTGLRQQLDFNEHPLVSGPPFRPEDLRIEPLRHMEASTSGICLLGINDGCDAFPAILEASWPSTYRLEGVLGRQTRDNLVKGRVIQTTEFAHISKGRMLKLLSKLSGHFRRLSIELSGIDPQSEKAFDLARKGIPRPGIPGQLMIHSLSLAAWKPPYFAVELSCCGETDATLRNLTNELGMSLGTVASPVRLSRRALGPFTPTFALLEKQISLQNVIRSVSTNKALIETALKSTSDVICETPEIAVQRRVVDCVGMRSADAEQDDAMKPYWKRHYA